MEDNGIYAFLKAKSEVENQRSGSLADLALQQQMMGQRDALNDATQKRQRYNQWISDIAAKKYDVGGSPAIPAQDAIPMPRQINLGDSSQPQSLGGIAEQYAPANYREAIPARAAVEGKTDQEAALRAGVNSGVIPMEAYMTHLAAREANVQKIKELAAQNMALEQFKRDKLASDSADRRYMADNRNTGDKSNKFVTDASGNTGVYDNNGNLIKNIGSVGKPTASFEKNFQARKKMSQDINMAISELEKATKNNGLISQSTGSGAGALVDMAAGFVGSSTKGAIAVNAMKPIYDIVLKMVPRFEGPQSDKDTASYEKAAGQLANPAVPNDIKLSSAKEILRLMKARKAQFIDKTAESSGIDSSQPATPNIEDLLNKYK